MKFNSSPTPIFFLLNRFTVRVVYTLGESLDSNCITASLSNEVQPGKASAKKMAPDMKDFSHNPLPVSRGRENLDEPGISGLQEMKPTTAKSCDYSISHQQAHSAGGTPNKQLSRGCHGTFQSASPGQLDGLDGPSEVPSTTAEGSYMHMVSHIRMEGNQTIGGNVEDDTKVIPPGLEQHDVEDVTEGGMVVTAAGSGSGQSNNPDFCVSGTSKYPLTPVGLLGQSKHSTDKQGNEVNISAVQLPGAIVPTNNQPPRLEPLFASLPPDTTIPPHGHTMTSYFPSITGNPGINSQHDTVCTQQFLSPAMSGLSYDGVVLDKTKQMTFFDPEGYMNNLTDNGPVQHAQRLLASNGPLLTKSVESECQAWGNVTVPMSSTEGDSFGAPAMESSEVETESMPHKGTLEAAISQEASSVQQTLVEAGNGTNSIPMPTSPTTNTPHKQVSLRGGNSSDNSNVCELEGCELTSTSRTGSQQCFDVDRAEQESPRTGSDSIRPLEPSAATIAPGAMSDGKPSKSLTLNAVSQEVVQLNLSLSGVESDTT